MGNSQTGPTQSSVARDIQYQILRKLKIKNKKEIIIIIIYMNLN